MSTGCYREWDCPQAKELRVLECIYDQAVRELSTIVDILGINSNPQNHSIWWAFSNIFLISKKVVFHCNDTPKILYTIHKYWYLFVTWFNKCNNCCLQQHGMKTCCFNIWQVSCSDKIEMNIELRQSMSCCQHDFIGNHLTGKRLCEDVKRLSLIIYGFFEQCRVLCPANEFLDLQISDNHLCCLVLWAFIAFLDLQ